MDLVKENAVFVRLLHETDMSASQAARVDRPEFGLREIETLRERCNLLIRDANRTGKTAAAVPALRALEAESVFVPGLATHTMMPSGHR